ncbi:MAG: hypothetical protein ABQ298_03335, partial [Puniceicoccaceae bacterium]
MLACIALLLGCGSVVSGEVVNALGISSAHQLEQYLTTEGEKPGEVEMDLVVYVKFWDPTWGLLWIADEHGTAFIPCSALNGEVAADRWYRISGTLHSTDGLNSETLRFLEVEPRFEVEFLEMGSLAPDLNQVPRNPMVTFEGVVDGVKKQDGIHYLIHLVAAGARIPCRVLGMEGSDLEVKQGDWVKGRGLLAFEPGMTLEESQLWVGSSDFLEVSNVEDSGRTISQISDFWDSINQNKGSEETWKLNLQVFVLYYDPHWELLWVNDGYRAGFLPHIGNFEFQTGQHYRITGEVVPIRGIESHRVDYERLSDVPTLRPDTRSMKNYFKHEVHYVELQMFVFDQSLVDERHLLLNGILEDQSVVTRVYLDANNVIPSFAGRWVSIRGVLVPFDETGSGYALWVPSLMEVALADELNRTTRAMEVMQLSQLESLADGESFHVRAEVLSFSENGVVTLDDGSGQLQFRLQKNLPLEVGRVLELWGTKRVQSGNDSYANLYYAYSEGSDSEAMERHQSWLLRMSEQVMDLSPEDAEAQLQVRLSGAVTYVDPEGRFLYLQDASGGVRVDIPQSQHAKATSIKHLDVIRVLGATRGVHYSPSVLAESIEPTGTSILLQSKSISLMQALTGVEDSQWVELQGFVREIRAEFEPIEVVFENTDGQFVGKFNHLDTGKIETNAHISINGVCEVTYDENWQKIHISVLVDSHNQFTVLKEAPATVDALPAGSVSSILQYNRSNNYNRIQRLRLHNLFAMPGEYFIGTDGSHSMRVLYEENTDLKFGQQVEVVGIPLGLGNRTVFKSFMTLPGEANLEVDPIVLTGENRLLPEMNGKFVEVMGTVVDRFQSVDEDQIYLQGNESIHHVVHYHTLECETCELAEEGSVVRLFGVNQIIVDDYGNATDSVVILVSP